MSMCSHRLDATETDVPHKDPSERGYRAAAPHSSPQGNVTQMCLLGSCQHFIQPQEGPHIPCEAASSANQDHTELALKSSCCEILFLCSCGLKREHPPSNFLSAATLKLAHIISTYFLNVKLKRILHLIHKNYYRC